MHSINLDCGLQFRNPRSLRKVTGRAGLPGPTVLLGSAPGPAAATQKGSPELSAEETPPVKIIVKQTIQLASLSFSAVDRIWLGEQSHL